MAAVIEGIKTVYAETHKGLSIQKVFDTRSYFRVAGITDKEFDSPEEAKKFLDRPSNREGYQGRG
jgi:hypothetical protein